MRYRNLTGHEVHELDSGIKLPPEDLVIRAKCKTSSYINEDGIQCHRTIVAKLSAPLPPQEDGVIYIVSALALNGVPPSRTDVVAPKQVERNSNGQIIGCRGFRHN